MGHDVKRVGDYAMIGDLRTSAMIAANGSLEWLCAPRFDSDASFAALLGDERNGHWQIAPSEPVTRVERRYRGPTMVLETTVVTARGTLRLVEFMPVGGAQAVVRIVEGVAGTVPCTMVLAPRMRYGLIAPRTERLDGAWVARLAPDGLCLRTPVELVDGERETRAQFTVAAGARVPFVLATFAAHDAPPAPLAADDALAHTQAWWETWAGQVRYEGPWRDAVLRSAILLKALSYEPAGSFVAAATTSLPERLGGDKNWDYRYVWLRDASFTVHALLRLGLTDEARRWRDWFLTVCAGQPQYLHIMYGLSGERLGGESEASWLPGFAQSPPVHISNAAAQQFQLGVYGIVLRALAYAQARGIPFDASHWAGLEPLLQYIEHVWQRPGNGMWETRDGGRQYVDSKVMAWVAMDCGLALAERGGFAIDRAYWRALADRVHAQTCAAGYDAYRGTFTQYFGSQELDASLLLAPIVGFLPAGDVRIAGTIAALEQTLLADGFLYRYSADLAHDGARTPPQEGTFTTCGFWLAQVYALTGRVSEARALFERLLATANDVGMLTEEFDVERGLAIGNVPQAISHAWLIEAASAIAEATR